ncbi:hypothetical protein [Eisenbergiella porci]|uniref:hypothetical protein n=1 Tax=Eisenbergiella porci TaxID=2652274 RepID=UPI002A80C6AF|nr:hypothetical protein [Eisenbergiella porci]
MADLLIKIGDVEYTGVWDNVLYKRLSHYPAITDWEIRNIIEFIQYEKKYGRECKIECENKKLLRQITEKIMEQDRYLAAPRPERITECTACPYRKGCMTDLVCHTASVENAIKIFLSGKLLPAVNARNVSVAELMREQRNAANDPPDYFEYIMFSWGNCQAGDRLVMERRLKRLPNEEDLSTYFSPGIRFYFIYDEIIKHPKAVFDGVLPIKIKDELDIKKWLFAAVIPKEYKDRTMGVIPEELKDRILYIENDCKDIWDWSEKVYCVVKNWGSKHS